MTTKKIMVVDDDEEFLIELKETLRKSGYSVKTVSEAPKALKTAVAINPDVILLDLKMQGLTGFEVANKLRDFSKTKEIPIIAMSGFFTEERDVTLLSFFKIDNYLQKPFNPLNVIAKIEAVLADVRNKRKKFKPEKT